MPWHSTSDGRIFWRERGAGRPLMLIHGLGSSGADWAFQVPPLVASHRLILPDLPGAGASDPPAGRLSIASMAEAMWALLDVQATERPQLVGFSLGGAVALEMALQRPAEVERLVLINSLPSYRVDHWKKWLELNLQIGLVRVLGLRRTARMVAARLFPLPHQAPMRARVSTVVGGSSPAPYLACARALAEWCAAERLAALQAPTLMIAGEHDYTGLDEKRRWARRLGARMAVVSGSRHGTPFDAVAATNACLVAFLCGGELPEQGHLVADTAASAPVEAPVTLD